MCYTIDMKNFEVLYDVAEGNFGLISFAQAKTLGISIRELDRWVKCGRLERSSRGLYRISRFSVSEYDPYAIAVESVGRDAYLHGESVLALLRLVPTNPTWIYVASPRRVRRKVGEGILVVQGTPGYEFTNYNGIRSQHLGDAILACGATVCEDRRVRAVDEGYRRGYLRKDERSAIKREVRRESASA